LFIPRPLNLRAYYVSAAVLGDTLLLLIYRP